MSSVIRGINIYTLHQRLHEKYDELYDITVSNLDSMNLCVQQRVFSVIFSSRGCHDVATFVNECCPDDDCRDDELESYKKELSRIIRKELIKLGWKSSTSGGVKNGGLSFVVEPTFLNKKVYLSVLSFLLSGKKSRRRSSSSSTSMVASPSSSTMRITTTSGEDLNLVRLENERLRAELEDMRAAYEKLMDIKDNESVNEHRIMMLKMQNMQLKRQVDLLNEGCEERSTVLHDVLSGLTEVKSLLEVLPVESVVRKEAQWSAWVSKLCNRLHNVCEQSQRARRTSLLPAWEYARRKDFEKLNLQQFDDGQQRVAKDDYLDVHKLHALECVLSELCASLTHEYQHRTSYRLGDDGSSIVAINEQIRRAIHALSTIGASCNSSITTHNDTVQRIKGCIDADKLRPKHVAEKLLIRVQRDYEAYEEQLRLLTIE